MIVYALASRETGEAVDLYATEAEANRPAEAPAALEDALADEPAWADELYVESVEFPFSDN
jgi:hypothetical protein